LSISDNTDNFFILQKHINNFYWQSTNFWSYWQHWHLHNITYWSNYEYISGLSKASPYNDTFLCYSL